jgi:transposase
MRSHLKKGSILFYCKATKEADYVHNLLMKEGKTVVKITSAVGRDKYLKNGVEIDKNELVGIKENIVYVATTKITTGVNLKNLIAIYQHGTAYDPNTFIQLTARLRSDGDYYLIKVKKETNQNSYNQNKAIHLSLLAKRFNVTNLSTAWQNKEFRDYLKKKTELPYKKSSVKDFLKTYSKAFQLIQSEGLGKLSEKKNNQDDDFEFVLKQHEDPTHEPVTKVSYLDGSQIKKTFVSADATTYIKYFERKLIDWLNRYGDIEEMNKIYNLSFDYINMNNNDWEEIKPKLFITEEDQNLKDEKKEEKKELLEEFQSEVTKKFQGLVTFEQLKENKLTDTNINKLLEDKRLDLKKYRDAIKAKRTIEAKIIALQFHLIPQAVIVEAVMALLRSGKLYITLKELSTQLEQYEFLTNKRAEAPFKKFLKDFFENDEFLKDELIFKSRCKVNGLEVYDVVTLPKETLKKLKAIKETEEREKALKIEVEKIEELTQKHESYLELLDSPERHGYYDMKQIIKDSIDIKEEINKTKGKIYETQ